MQRQRARGLPEGLFKRVTRSRGNPLTEVAHEVSPTGDSERGWSYIFRKVIPPELRQRLGRREWHVSLGTTDVVLARVKAAVEGVLAERAFAEAREALALESASAELAHQDHAAALVALAGALEAEQDSTRRSILAALLRGVASSPEAIGRDGQMLTDLLGHWLEAEQPSIPEYRAVETAVNRFVKALGDRRAADVMPSVLEEFEHVLATTPYQKSGQPLHRAGREATVGAIQRLVQWFHEGEAEAHTQRSEQARP